jgi:hypothetical protein
VLTDRHLVFALGSGSIYRTGEIPILQARVEVFKRPQDFMESLLFGHEDSPSAHRLEGAGSAAATFIDELEEATQKLQRLGVVAAEAPAETSPAAGGMLVSLRVPDDMHQLVTLLERLGELHASGVIDDTEFARCKRQLLGE